jgi:hyperosmotically inducible periplasmic protein
MRAIQFRPISAGVLSAVALLALGACSPSDREQARSDANRAAQTARTETSKAAAGAEKALDDAALTTKVKTALLADPQVKGTQINVDSNNGIVTLSGSVATASEKMRAEQLAHNVDGVKAVTNNLAAPQ